MENNGGTDGIALAGQRSPFTYTSTAQVYVNAR